MRCSCKNEFCGKCSDQDYEDKIKALEEKIKSFETEREILRRVLEPFAKLTETSWTNYPTIHISLCMDAVAALKGLPV